MNTVDVLNKNIRRNIKMLCNEKKLTESELAQKINIKKSDLKDPVKKLSVNSIFAICRVLDININDLLKEEV